MFRGWPAVVFPPVDRPPHGETACWKIRAGPAWSARIVDADTIRACLLQEVIVHES
jgi:hypothetical protein